VNMTFTPTWNCPKSNILKWSQKEEKTLDRDSRQPFSRGAASDTTDASGGGKKGRQGCYKTVVEVQVKRQEKGTKKTRKGRHA